MSSEQTYTDKVMAILAEMNEDALHSSVNMDTKHGQLLMISNYGDKLRLEAEFIKVCVPLYKEYEPLINNWIFDNLSQLTDQDDKVHFIWRSFMVKVACAPSAFYVTGAICYFVPTLVDALDSKI